MIEPYGLTLFGDDLRQEVGGKMSLMGIYGADLIVGAAFPVMLRLALINRIYIPSEGFAGETLRVVTLLPEIKDPVSEVTIVIPEALPSTFAQARPEDHDPAAPRYMMLGMNFALPNVPIEKAGFVRVRGYIKDQVIRCGALHVRTPQTPDEANVLEQLNPKM